jgi:hypothetical protein
MGDTDEEMRSGSSNSTCMHDWFKPQRRDRSRVEGSIQPHSIGTRTCITQCNADGPAGSCWFEEERGTQVKMNDKRMQRGPLKLIVHARLGHDTDTDQIRVEGSIHPHSIGTRTLITQCDAESVGSLRWFAKERGTQIRMNGSEEGTQSGSSN